jgi:hypothetical protein
MRVIFDKYMYRDADGDAPFRVYANVNDVGEVVNGRAVLDGTPKEAWFSVEEGEYCAAMPEYQASNLDVHCWEQAIVGVDWALYEAWTDKSELRYRLVFAHDSDLRKQTERLVELDFCASSPPFPTEIHCVPYCASDFPRLTWRRCLS